MRAVKTLSVFVSIFLLTTMTFARGLSEIRQDVSFDESAGAEEDYNYVVNFVRSTAPYVDLSQIDLALITAAYDELNDKEYLSGAFKTLHRVLRSYQTKFINSPKVLPAKVVAECVNILEQTSEAELKEMSSIVSLINGIILNGPFVNNEELNDMVDRCPSYFLYLAKNIYVEKRG